MRGIWLLAAVVFMLTQFGISVAQDQAKPKKLNPYTGNPEAIKEGRQLYFLYGCSGCHGKKGGGGMGRPLIDDEWTFGSDDETLFKLIRGQIPEQTMPLGFGKVMKEEETWKILAYIRSLYKGDSSLVNW
jgi:cytochrome c(L)